MFVVAGWVRGGSASPRSSAGPLMKYSRSYVVCLLFIKMNMYSYTTEEIFTALFLVSPMLFLTSYRVETLFKILRPAAAERVVLWKAQRQHLSLCCERKLRGLVAVPRLFTVLSPLLGAANMRPCSASLSVRARGLYFLPRFCSLSSSHFWLSLKISSRYTIKHGKSLQ